VMGHGGSRQSQGSRVPRLLGARSAMECGSLIPLWCARRRTVGRKHASGYQGGSFAAALHSQTRHFHGAPMGHCGDLFARTQTGAENGRGSTKNSGIGLDPDARPAEIDREE
jgi:hypothetical protein